MSERPDDTTEPSEQDAPPEPEHAPGSYYYDDGTGYEIYDPAKDEEEEDEPGENDATAEAAGDERRARRWPVATRRTAVTLSV